MAKTTDDALLECAISFAFTDSTGVSRVIPKGTTWRSSDDVVTAHPQYFIGSDTPTSERPRMEDFMGPGITTTHKGIPSGQRGRGMSLEGS